LLQQAFAGFAADPQADEVAGAILVARLLEPGLDARVLADDLETIAAGCGAVAPWIYLDAIGFRGNTDSYEAVDNSHLARVLATRQGLPITLGVILIYVARKAARQAVGVNFPGHFLVLVDGQLVDPFVMEVTSAAACLGRLPATSRNQPATVLFAPATPQVVVLRMLNNLKAGFAGRGVWHQALDVVAAQLALLPDQPGLHLESGDLWLRLGSVTSARAAFERAAALASQSGDATLAPLARLAGQRLESLRGAGDVLH
jgi:regulator of sirC expression with transglutaminase-like and TPR domain